MVRKHIVAVAWLNLLAASFVVVCVSIIWVAAARLAVTFEGSFIPGLVAMFGKPIASVLIFLATLQLVCAIALLRGRRWPRYPLVFISLLLLFVFPIGTAVGVYTLWAMSTTSSENKPDSNGRAIRL